MKLLSGLLKLFKKKEQPEPVDDEYFLQLISEQMWCGCDSHHKAKQDSTENSEPSKNEPDQVHSEH